MKVRISTWLLLAGLILLGGIAYVNSFDVPFAYDDFETIQTNDTLKMGVYSHWSNFYYLRARSLTYASFAFNNWLGGQHVFGYHVINLLLHILNGLLIFAIAVRIFRKVLDDPTTVPMYAALSAA